MRLWDIERGEQVSSFDGHTAPVWGLAVNRDGSQAASGGEDYELLAALPPERLQEANRRMAAAAEASLTEIGRVAAGGGVELRLPGGGLLEARGYDHFGEPRHGSR